MPQTHGNIKLFVAIMLMVLGFLMSIVAFIELYRSYLYLPYPEIQTLSDEAGQTANKSSDDKKLIY